MAEDQRRQQGAPLYNALQGRFIANPEPQALGKPFKIGGQWYRQVDNGRADVLVPADDPTISPMQRAQQRAAIERAFLMASSPLAGAAYGVAALAGGSPGTRNRAMAVGGAADAVMQGIAPLGPQSRRAGQQPPAQTALVTLPRKPAVYGGLTETDQSTGLDARITPSMLGTGRGVKRGLKPPGLSSTPRKDNQARAHLLGNQLGGTADTLDQVFTITQAPTNNSDMIRFENAAAGRARNGEVIDYFVRPLYDAPASPPSGILMSARGSRGDFTPRYIRNPAGRLK